MSDPDLRLALAALESFLAASARGDRDAMQRVLTRASIADGSYDNPPPPELSFLPGTPRKEGARVLIPMRLMPPGATADTPPIATFTSVLVQEDGGWKLDVIATREQPSPEMDALANQMMQQMSEALGGAMQQMGDAMQQMGQALGEAFSGGNVSGAIDQDDDARDDEDDARRG